MGYVLTVAGRKGGTSKSSLCMALAGAVQADKETCLLVDLDPQASLTRRMLLTHDGNDIDRVSAEMTCEALAAGVATVDDLAIELPHCPGVSIIPARPEMKVPARALPLHQSKASVVLVDTAPDTRLGETVAALLSCDAVLTPCPPTSLAISTLPMTISSIADAVARGARCHNLGVVLTQVQPRKMTVQDDCISQLRRAFGSQALTAVMPFCVDFQEAATLGLTPWQIKKKSKGAKAASELWAEIMDRVVTLTKKGAA